MDPFLTGKEIKAIYMFFKKMYIQKDIFQAYEYHMLYIPDCCSNCREYSILNSSFGPTADFFNLKHHSTHTNEKPCLSNLKLVI